eukprot:7112015-Lingulodinium_polyedra.AAC.1
MARLMQPTPKPACLRTRATGDVARAHDILPSDAQLGAGGSRQCLHTGGRNGWQNVDQTASFVLNS